MLILTSCATTTGSDAPTESFCALAKPIHWSAKDTDETIIEVKEHNAVWKKYCGGGH
jgi:hypothetical protein